VTLFWLLAFIGSAFAYVSPPITPGWELLPTSFDTLWFGNSGAVAPIINWLEIRSGMFSRRILNPSQDAHIFIPTVRGNVQLSISISGKRGDKLIALSSLRGQKFYLEARYRPYAGINYLTEQSREILFYETSEIELNISGVSPESLSWTLLLLIIKDQNHPFSPLLTVAVSEPIVVSTPAEIFELTPESRQKCLGVWGNNYFAFLEKERVTVEIEIAHLLAEKLGVDGVSVQINKRIQAPFIEEIWEDGGSTHLIDYVKISKITPGKTLRRLIVSGVIPRVEAIEPLDFVLLSLYKGNELVESYAFPVYAAPERIKEFHFIKEEEERIAELEGRVKMLQDERNELQSALQAERSINQKEITHLKKEVSLLSQQRMLLSIFCLFLVVLFGLFCYHYRSWELITGFLKRKEKKTT
jgi:hypothetical protein